MPKISILNFRLAILGFGDALVILFNSMYLVVLLMFLCLTFTSPTSFFLEQQKTMPVWGIDYVKQISMSALAQTNARGMYDLEVQRQWMQEKIDPLRYTDVRNVNPSYYTPPLCAALIPLSWLPLEKGYILWLSLQVLVAIVVVQKIGAQGKNWFEWCYFWFLILSSPAPRQSIFLGQTGFLMTAILSGVFLCWKNNKQIGGGALLAVAALIKPHHCLVAMIMFLAKRQWRAVIAFAGATLILYALSAIVLGFPVVLGYPTALDALERASYAHKYEVTMDICINIRGILTYWLPPEPVHLIGLATVSIAALSSYAIWRKAIIAGPSTYGFALFTTMCIALVGNLHANFYDITMLALPFAISIGAVGLFNTFNKPNIENRWWCVCFVLFWTGSQILSLVIPFRMVQNWHALYLTVFGAASWCLFVKSCRQTESIRA